MKTNHHPNVISQRFDVLNTQYETFRENKGAKICLWLIQHDEQQMLDAFYQVENTEQGQFNDVFLRFESAFETAAVYDRQLSDEFLEFLNNEKAALENEGADASFLSGPNLRQPGILQALSSFGAVVPDLKDGSVVAWFAPAQVYDFAAWEDWLIECCNRGIPPNVRLMIVCPESQHGFARLRSVQPEAVFTIVPKLDMPSAMRQLAASGDRNDPGTQFRMHFVEMGQAAAAANLEKMQAEGLKAVNIAQQQAGWEHLEVAAYVSMGHALMKDQLRSKESLQQFENACRSGQRAVTSENPAGYIVLSQAMFAKAAALLVVRDFEQAGQVYEAIVPVSEKVKNGAFQTMEAWRMAGYCHEQNNKTKKAWDCQLAALNTAEQLEETLRAHSTAPYIGQALVRLSEILGKHQELPPIRQKLESWLGPDWETHNKQPKMKST